MSELADYDIATYEVGYNLNDQSHIVYVGYSLEDATVVYEYTVETHAIIGTTNHIIVWLYDYEKQSNINYYNNYDEIC